MTPTAPRLRQLAVLVAAILAAAACSPSPQADPAAPDRAVQVDPQAVGGIVTVSGDDRISETLTWQSPKADIGDDAKVAAKQADAALSTGDLYADGTSAIPLYLALSQRTPAQPGAAEGLRHALQALIVEGDAALAESGDDIAALRLAHERAAVARAVDAEGVAVAAFLERVDTADRMWELNSNGERALADGDYGQRNGGALAAFREALALQPAQPRALQGLAATESAMIRQAEIAARKGNFDVAARWLGDAAKLRPQLSTVPDAQVRIDRMRDARIARLRDLGVADLLQRDGLEGARGRLVEILRIARPGNAMASELRERIDLAEHYGLFRPGQTFTDGLTNGARGPQMMVVPHGAFRMGALGDDADADDNERPARNLQFDRGFAMAVTEVTAGDFRRFINSTRRETRAAKQGYSLVYDERSGNFTRRSGVDWRSDYAGDTAVDDQPVLHVSQSDAEAYAEWLSKQSDQRYRLPSEAEFEYALRAGGEGTFPWGKGRPPRGSGNFTGARDHSPDGRRWSNAFAKYGDGAWGPARVGRYAVNAWGLHDMDGNVSEWVADCWHDGYRRAPRDGSAWINPGCRTHVVRGGSWASAPVQTRSSWRAPASTDTANARIGFRVVREL